MRPRPIPVAERFLLVEDDRTVPYARLRLTSSRDYRRPPEVCVTVEPDGVTLALDPARADLLVDAELAQFADPVPVPERASAQSGTSLARRFAITGESLQRGISRGMALARLNEWFERRAGRRNPAFGSAAPHGQVVARAARSRPPGSWCSRCPHPNCSKACASFPPPRSFLGERLGPTSVAIPEDQVAPLQSALKELGISFELRVTT